MQTQSGPNTGCFSGVLLLFGARKFVPKKLKFFFSQDKFYFLKAHAHYYTVLIYLATWRAAKLGIYTHFTFTILPWCSQSINSIVYVYSIKIPSWFLWFPDHSHDCTSTYYCHPKNFSVLPPAHVLQSSCSGVINQNVFDQSDCRILVVTLKV